MENFGDEYKNYWETTMFFQNEELEYDSWAFEEALSGSGESSSPDGAATSPASKNVLSERNRRHRLNQRLLALRSVVPNISKLDKASVIRDSIAYIEELREQEKRLEAEIRELESLASSYRNPTNGYNDNYALSYQYHQELLPSGKTKARSSPIEILELKVTCMGEKTGVVCITCSKKRDTMVRLCEVFESLNLKIITANISSFSGRLSNTLFLEVEEEEGAILEAKIHTAIAAFNDSRYGSPMSF
ncbi:PREDICTED: transcription factor bHLH27-like [Tarenaya hassleriana]|uniref:transcription factor bHLH27-like n=1 Tax=Tarenaya hassleriana TaxID=28532 RepID=UPI00053C986C|nr:PREDICTED: transcription factor bHLH27-like [Tarenaya hassleriana]